MRHLSTRHLLAIVALVAGFAFVAPAAAQGGLAGDWMLTFNTPMGSLDSSATFKVDGDKVTGTLDGPTGSAPLAGTVKENAFTLNFEIQTGQGPITITMEGTVEGDAVKGTFNFGQGSSEFSGKRKAQ